MKCENCKNNAGNYKVDTCFGTWHFCGEACRREKREKLGYEGGILDKELIMGE